MTDILSAGATKSDSGGISPQEKNQRTGAIDESADIARQQHAPYAGTGAESAEVVVETSVFQKIRALYQSGERSEPEPDPNEIGDPRFMVQLKRLTALRDFALQEAVGSERVSGATYNLGSLNLLKAGRYFDAERGRAPSREEWDAVEAKTAEILSGLSETQRKRFRLGFIPWWTAIVPAGFTALAAIAIAIPLVQASGDWSQAAEMIGYMAWIGLLGAIGSTAFVGMNALSVQSDATFDLNNQRLLVMRVSLGALFGLVLTLPFGLAGFLSFFDQMIDSVKHPGQAKQVDLIRQMLSLLMPFVLGFSTSLVIMILNRLVESVNTLFGQTLNSRQTSQAPSGGSTKPI